MADVEINSGAIHASIRGDHEVSADIERRLKLAADYWEQHARRDTGHMASAVETYVLDNVDGLPEGHIEMTAPYAGYQEYGTEYIEGMHLMGEVTRLMEEG